MRRLLAAAGTTVLAGVAAFGLAGTPAQAAPASYTSLRLTIAEGEAAWPWDEAASLWCEPPGGSHTQAGDACAELAAVDGDIAALPGQPLFCTYEVAPVTVTATGYWQGRKVTYQETFGNRCELLRETGTVFAF